MGHRAMGGGQHSVRNFFFGGIHPAFHKEHTQRKSIAPLELMPEQVVIPLSTDGADMALPAVRPGDRVQVGQPIALGQGLTDSVHASVSGRVVAIEARPHPWGGRVPAIVIQNDGQNTPWPHRPAPLEAKQVELELLLGRVREAGITDMGDGADATAETLRQAAGKIDTLIVNAAECEPYITADHRLLLEHGDEILRCSGILARCLKVEQAVLVTAGDKLNAVESLERLLSRRPSKVQLRTVRARYPLGAEKQIVQTVTGREIPLGKTALDVKCLVVNVATVYAIYQCLFEGLALTHRAVTVAGGAVAHPRNLWVPIGTPLRYLLEATGGLKEQPRLILTGGPMMGTPLKDLEAPVVKNTNALICLTGEENRQTTEESTCIRCGKCVTACPMHLIPVFISRAVRQNEPHRLPALHPEDCMECGCCSYSCPARIPLLELVRQGREILAKGGQR